MRRGWAAAFSLVLIFTIAVASGGQRKARAQSSADLGPELSVGEPVDSVAPLERFDPEMAAGDDGFLAVWDDERKCCDVLTYASRISPDGRPLDPIGFPIGKGTYGDGPHVAWDGSQYVVVWEGSSPDPDLSSAIYAARVTPDGEVLDDPPIVVVEANETRSVFAPTVDSAGGGSLIAWTNCVVDDGYRCRDDVAGARIDMDGHVEQLGTLVGGPGNQRSPGLVAGADRYLLFWMHGRSDELRAIALDSSGDQVSDSVFLSEKGADPNDEKLQAAYSDGQFLVAWGEEPTSGNYEIVGRRVTPDGALVDTQPIVIASGGTYLWSTDVTAYPDGGWALVWGRLTDSERLYVSIVDSEGRVEDPEGSLLVELPGNERDGALGFQGNRPVLVWYSMDDRVYSVGADDVTELQNSSPNLVSQSPNDQLTPSIAWNGEVFLVVWADSRGDRKLMNVYAARITPTGEVLDEDGIRVVTPGNGWTTPVVASDGQDFLVVWLYGRNGLNRDVFATRVSGDGEVLDEEPIVVSDARKTKNDPDVVWTGRDYLVVWEDYRSSGASRGRFDGSGNADVYGARVTAEGEVLDPSGIRVAGGKRKDLTPQLAVGSRGTALVWSRDCRRTKAKQTCTHDVLAARLDRDGQRVGEALGLGDSIEHEVLPSVTATPDGYLAAWTNWRTRRFSIRMRGITSDWRLKRKRTLDLEEEWQNTPHLEWMGEWGLLSWIDSPRCFHCGGDVFMTRVSETGVPLDPEPTAVTTLDQFESVMDMTRTSGNCAAIAYDREHAEPGVTRSFVRLFGTC